jgi:hypothetical protein
MYGNGKEMGTLWCEDMAMGIGSLWNVEEEYAVCGVQMWQVE